MTRKSKGKITKKIFNKSIVLILSMLIVLIGTGKLEYIIIETFLHEGLVNSFG